MSRIRRIWTTTAVVLVLGAVLGGAASAGSMVVLPRPGQVGVSGSYLYGTLLDSGNLGDQFSSGPGLAVRLRYRMRYERGVGLSFEAHGLDPRGGPQVDLFDNVTVMDPAYEFAYKRLHMYLYGVDFYQMFGTRTKTVKLLSVGGGIAHPTFELKDGENEYPLNDGTYLSFGAGVERFFWQGMAFDLGMRYQALFLRSELVKPKVNHDLQASVGVIYYVSL
jgi:hypothetical protein